MPPTRWLATVLFLDMVGSTERAAELGDRRWRELLKEFHRRVRLELFAGDGREIMTAGDGFFATFAAPERAILCACAIRGALHDLRIDVRIGMHLGEVEVLDKTVGGIGVHIGARAAGLAKGGEVLVTQTVRDAVEGSGVTFVDRGIHKLKGVPGEWRLYVVGEVPEESLRRTARGGRRAGFLRPSKRALLVGACAAALALTLLVAFVLLRGPDAADGPLEAKKDALTGDRSTGPGGPGDGGSTGSKAPNMSAPGAAPAIAVLPFDVRDPELQEWHEDLVDLLSTGLDNVAGLRAIHEGTVLARWREEVQGEEAPDLDVKLSVARRAGARYAVTGSLLPVGDQVRLIAQVYDLPAGAELERTPPVLGSPDSMIDVVDRLAIEILRSIGRRDIPQLRLSTFTTSSLPAWRAYLDGEVLYRRSDFEGAISAYQQALEKDSTFALALSRLGMAYGWADVISTRRVRDTVERLTRNLNRLSERDRQMVIAGLAYLRGQLASLDLMWQMILRYPDDPEAWNLLGDVYYHLGGQALAADSVDTAFSHALQLDSTFTPAYIHLIEDTFHRADSARVSELVRAYARLAPGTRFDQRNRLAYTLAFGSSDERAAALTAVDTTPSAVLKDLIPNLRNARFLEVQAAVLEKVSGLKDNPDGELGGIYAFSNEARRGHGSAARRLLTESRVPAWFRNEGAYLLSALDMVTPADSQTASGGQPSGAQGAGAHSRPVGVAAFYSGALAVDQGDSERASAMLLELRSEASGLTTAGDSLAGSFLKGAADGLEGYKRWKRNRDPTAAAQLETARKTATGLAREQVEVNATIRWWLGGIAEESGSLHEAERYWSSLERDPFSAWQHPLVTHRLAQVYERLGQKDRARAAYAEAEQAWRGADPSLRFLMDKYRAADGVTLARPRASL